MNKTICIVALMLCSAVSAFSQEQFLSGIIADAETSEPLVGATITVDDKDAVMTNIDGAYKINITAGTHAITFSFLGYEPRKQTIEVKENESLKLDARLKPSMERLNLIVVSASQYQKNIAEETVSMEVLSKDLIQNTNSRDAGEAISKTPGVQVQDGQISIRSGSSYSYGVGTRTAFLVDNLNLKSADLGQAQLKFAQIENVQQIEVIKGASSVVYGSSALNGVVNLRTVWPKTGEKSTEFSMYYGIYGNPPRDELKWWYAGQPNFSGLQVSHMQRKKNLQLVAGGNIDYINSYLEQANEFRARANFKTNYILPKNERVSFGIDGNMMWESSDRFFISQDLDSNAYLIEEGSEDRYLLTNVDPHLTYQNEKGHRYQMQSRYLNIWRKGNGTDPNASSTSFQMDNQYQYNWRNKVIVTAGIPFDVGVSRSNLYEGTRVTFSGAGYVQGEYKYRKLSLVAGVRYELSRVDTIFETTIPVFRSGLNYQVGKSTFLRASWGQAYRLPTVGERFIAADIFNGFHIIPNADLVAEKGWGMEAGVKQGIKIKKWLGYFDFAMFWNEYDQYVEYIPGLYPNRDKNGNKLFPDEGNSIFGLHPENVQEARIFGFEASVAGTGKIGPVEITTLFGYTYTYAGNLETDSTTDAKEFIKKAFKNFARRIPIDDPDAEGLLSFRSRHIVRGDIGLQYKKFSVGYTLYFTSFPEKIPPLFVLATRVLDGGQGTLQKYIDNHENGDLVMDARIAYEITQKIRLSFMIKNLTNWEYSTRPGKLEAPRNFTLQFRFKF